MQKLVFELADLLDNLSSFGFCFGVFGCRDSSVHVINRAGLGGNKVSAASTTWIKELPAHQNDGPSLADRIAGE